jgi:hypothetical protein
MSTTTIENNGDITFELFPTEIAEYSEFKGDLSKLERIVAENVLGDDFRFITEEEQIALGDMTSCPLITTKDENIDKNWNDESWIYPIYTTLWFMNILEHPIRFIRRGNM